MIHLRAGASSLVGQVRSANEDAYLVTDDLVAVADGMGGHLAGEVASALTVEVLAGVAGTRSLADLVLSVHLANRNITEQAAGDGSLRGMGTTVCAVGLVDEGGEHLAILNVGDSRVYLLANGELSQLTEDHSLVETLVREGRITQAEAEVHPQRNVLTRALGVEALVVVDAWLLAPCEGDRLLLCSDGLFNEISPDRIAEILGEGDEPDVTARRLTAEADAAGGRDNVTAVVADLSAATHPNEPLGNRFRRIATPTVDLDDADHDPANDTATVPLVPISAAPSRTHPPEDDDREEDEFEDDEGDDQSDPGGESEDVADGSSGDLDLSELDEALDRLSASTGDQVGSTEASTDSDQPADEQSDRRRITWRTPVFVVTILMVIAGAFGVVALVTGRGWFVGPDGATVAIYRGTPNGFLWIHPQLQQGSEVRLTDLTQRDRSDVEEERRTFSDLARAQRYLSNLEQRSTTTTTATTTTTTTTTSTPTIVLPPETAPVPIEPPPAPADPNAQLPA